MRSQFYTTLLLAFAIQLDYFILHADAEDIKKPEISVQNSGGEVELACQTKLEHLPSGTNVTCNLYIGDSSEPFRSTWTKNKDKVCIFIVKRDALKHGLQSVGATEVSCDYSVPTYPRSPSPRSDKRKIEGLSPEPSTFSKADLKKPEISVKNSRGKVDLACQTKLEHLPSGTSIRCKLYIGDSSEPFRSTRTTHTYKVCNFVVKLDDLKQGLQSVGNTEVSCDYSVPTYLRSPSPRSDKIKIDKTTSPPAVTTKKTSTAHSTTTFNTTASLQSTSAARSAVTAASRTSHHSSGKVTSQPPQTPAQQTAGPPTVPPIEPPTEPRTVPPTEPPIEPPTEPRTVPTTEPRTVPTTEPPIEPTTEQRTVTTTEQRTASTTEQLMVSTTEGISRVILPVGIGSAVGVAVLGMTAVCLCKRYKKQKSKRRTEHINSSLYASVEMENILSASNTGGIDGIYTEINNVPSTFKSPPVPSQNDTYSLITAVPASSKLPLPDASVEMENILSASNTGGTDGIYTEINNVPFTFKSPPVPSQNDTYSLIPAVPASSKLPLPAQDDAHTAHHSATYSTLQMH